MNININWIWMRKRSRNCRNYQMMINKSYREYKNKQIRVIKREKRKMIE